MYRQVPPPLSQEMEDAFNSSEDSFLCSMPDPVVNKTDTINDMKVAKRLSLDSSENGEFFDDNEDLDPLGSSAGARSISSSHSGTSNISNQDGFSSGERLTSQPAAATSGQFQKPSNIKTNLVEKLKKSLVKEEDFPDSDSSWLESFMEGENAPVPASSPQPGPSRVNSHKASSKTAVFSVNSAVESFELFSSQNWRAKTIQDKASSQDSCDHEDSIANQNQSLSSSFIDASVKNDKHKTISEEEDSWWLDEEFSPAVDTSFLSPSSRFTALRDENSRSPSKLRRVETLPHTPTRKSLMSQTLVDTPFRDSFSESLAFTCDEDDKSSQKLKTQEVRPKSLKF